MDDLGGAVLHHREGRCGELLQHSKEEGWKSWRLMRKENSSREVMIAERKDRGGGRPEVRSYQV